MNGATKHGDDLTLRDLEKYLAAPYGVRFEQLAGFPPPSRSGNGGAGRWACADVLPFMTGFYRGLAPMSEGFDAMVRAEAKLRPDAPAQEHRERALDRFTQVATARVFMRRLP